MELIDYRIYSGMRNMQIDEELLNESIMHNRKKGLYRLYGWAPVCISIGRNQSLKFINKEILSKYGIDCVKRLTGGRALLHDNELTYSCVVPVSTLKHGENILNSYKEISGIWIEIFKKFGITLTIGGMPKHITKSDYCMTISTGADLCYMGKKLIGSAQYRKSGYILQHGSILFDYNETLINTVFGGAQDFSSIIALKQINPELTLNDVIQAAKEYITRLVW